MQPNYRQRKGIYKQNPITQHPVYAGFNVMSKKKFMQTYYCNNKHISIFARNKWIVVYKSNQIFIHILCLDKIQEYLN